MEEIVNDSLKSASQQMNKALEFAEKEILKVRAGKAMPDMLDSLEVSCYGTTMPLVQLATVNTPDAQTLVVQPFDNGTLLDIEKSIKQSSLGYNPQIDDNVIRINVPALTQERRTLLVKQVKQEGENGKISLRNIRKELNTSIKKMKSDGLSEDSIREFEHEINVLTSSYSQKIDVVVKNKENDLMQI